MLDSHHVDDEDEAASYVNLYVKNSMAFVMQMSRSDEKQDCDAVAGSNSMHEFRYGVCVVDCSLITSSDSRAKKVSSLFESYRACAVPVAWKCLIIVRILVRWGVLKRAQW